MVASWVTAPTFASRELRLSWEDNQLGLSSGSPRAKQLVSQITGSGLLGTLFLTFEERVVR